MSPLYPPAPPERALQAALHLARNVLLDPHHLTARHPRCARSQPMDKRARPVSSWTPAASQQQTSGEPGVLHATVPAMPPAPERRC